MGTLKSIKRDHFTALTFLTVQFCLSEKMVDETFKGDLKMVYWLNICFIQMSLGSP